MKLRKALIIGNDYYQNFPRLYGCVNDAHCVKAALDRDSDGTVNFSSLLLTGTGATEPLTRKQLRDSITELFAGDFEIALLYFAGHGYIDKTGGYLMASDSEAGVDGLSLRDIMALADHSLSKNRIIVLDSCHSGSAGSLVSLPDTSELKEGTTILAASTANQYSSENNGRGVFSTLFVDALNGAGGNLVGDVTPGSVYAHIDQSLGPWEQRPVFKTNVKTFVSLRKVHPPIALEDLRKIATLFPVEGQDLQLDPTFEPERHPGEASLPPPNPVNTAKFAILQKYNRVGLVVPVDAPHMWHAAMNSKSCKLTVLGEHYCRLVAQGKI